MKNKPETRHSYYEKNKKALTAYNLEWVKNNPKSSLLYKARIRSKQRGVPCTISYKDISIPKRCPVLGIKLSKNKGKGPCNNSPTIDCILPSLGYVKGNIKVISMRANRIKNDASLIELVKICDYIRKYTND